MVEGAPIHPGTLTVPVQSLGELRQLGEASDRHLPPSGPRDLN